MGYGGSHRPWPLRVGLPAVFSKGRLFAVVLSAVHALAAEDPVPVVATFSDDTSAAGELHIIGSRPLTVVPIGEDRQRMFLLRDLASIEQEVENAGMQRPWSFKESGKTEKVYRDGEYPLINFRTRLTLINGSVVTGHVISVALSFKTGQEKKKIFLQQQIKGTKEEKLADVFYVRSIRMTANALAGGGPLRGSVEDFGRVESVTALDNERGYVLFAKVTAENLFDFGTVLPGSYDLCVLTDTHALTGHSDATPCDKKGDALLEGDLAAMNAKFPLADDFFNDRWILALRGNRTFAKALVYKRRSDYYEAERWTPGGFLWHLEVWDWHFASPDWKVDQRHILIRHKQKGGEKNRKLMTGKMLDAVKPGRELHLRADKGTDEAWHFIRDLN